MTTTIAEYKNSHSPGPGEWFYFFLYCYNKTMTVPTEEDSIIRNRRVDITIPGGTFVFRRRMVLS